VQSGIYPQLGDRLRVWRGAYWHYGMYLWNGNVIEHAGMQGGGIQVVPVAVFSRGSPIEVLPHLTSSPFTRVQAVQRALSRLGERFFDLFRWNCEHFVNDAAYGNPTSTQATHLSGALVVGGLLGLLGMAGNGSLAKRVGRWH